MASAQSRLVAGYQQAVATATRDDKQRLGLVAKLMISGYYVPEMTVAEFKVQASDWRADLSPYPPETVSQACNDYRQNAVNTQRPLPAQIASLCSRIMFESLERFKRKALPAPQASPEDRRTSRFAFTPEELDERREYATLAGYADWQVFLDAVHEGRESVMPFLQWSRARRSLPEPVQGFKTLG